MTADIQTSARFPRSVLDRLKGYGLKDQTYSEIVEKLMDRVDRDEYIAEQFRRARDKKNLIADKSVKF
jgi:hypothetical protein